MLSINMYEFILNNCIDLEDFVSKYAGSFIDKYGDTYYIHKCPFCNEDLLNVDCGDADLGNSDFSCYNCEASGNVIDFYAKLKNINKYDAIVELIKNLKKESNLETLSDFAFALTILDPSKIELYDNFLEYLNYYEEITNKSKKYQKNELIYSLSSKDYKWIDMDFFDNLNYIYEMLKQEQNDPESSDYSFLEYISPNLRKNQDFLIKLDHINILPYGN